MDAAFLARGRAFLEARMKSRATVRRKTGEMITGANGLQVPEWETIYAELPCRIDSGGTTDGGSRGVTISGVTYEEATGIAHFPHPSALLQDNDLVLVTSGEWPGECHRIVKAIRQDQKTARRLPIVEEALPEEWA